MHKSRRQIYNLLVFLVVLAVGAVVLSRCGGSSQPLSATTGTVNVSMTDPATCSLTFPNVYLTVTKVTAHLNADAGPSDSGWQTLVDLTNSPMQIDLAALATPSLVCLLKTLGSSGPLPAGKYQQIRLYLLSNNPGSGVAVPSSNSCGTSAGWNCVMTNTGPVELQLPSEVQTGLKIPSTNIMSGGLTVTAGQSVDLDIDFQSCASIVAEGNGMYRLKPVLFAGEVPTDMNSISGQVVVGNSSGQPALNGSGQATPIANATVLFEQPTGGTEVIMDSTVTDSNGNFFVCPLPAAGPYDIVVTAQTSGTGGTTTYNPTVAFNVPLGTKLSNLPLVPEAASTMSTGGAATITGQVDTATSTSEDVTLTPTMSLTPTGGSATNVVIPVFGVTSQPPSVTTAAQTTQNPACASGSDCYNFMLMAPASNANVGTFSSGAVTYGGPATGNIIYTVTATSGSCTTGTASATTASPGVSPDTTTTLPSALSLSGCT
jgi:Domain of unknown function (DUF4382)